MLPSDSTEGSNWGFAQVHHLLRSPINGGSAGPSHHNESTFRLFHEEQSVDASPHDSRKGFTSSRLQPSRTRLGDFGPLWKLLHEDPASTSVTPTLLTTNPDLKKGQSSFDILPSSPSQGSVKDGSFSDSSNTECTGAVPRSTSPIIGERKRRVLKDTITNYASDSTSRASVEYHSFSILKRPSGHEPLAKNTNVTFDISRTPTKTVTRAGDENTTPKVKRKPRSRGKGFRNDPFSSEGSAGVDSDASFIFDRPMPGKYDAFAFVPSQVGAPEVKNNQYDTPPSSYDDQDWTLSTNPGLASGGTRIRSALYQSISERRAALMTRLLREFPDYAKLAYHVGQALPVETSESIHSQPIHIFVDMSNILVGFHDSVKASRNIPLSTRIRRVHMSFANLALIMERERQTAKRVLVGSDRLPCVDEAERLGYEPNILERVHKMKPTKPITPRRNKSWKNSGSGSQGASSGPETVAASGERWVEQGVDEILHLKILESLLDTDKPATIVLATGDAAVAEFSGGFMKMVERALQRGWIVELVSFASGTSYAYRKKEFRQQWGEQFKLVELDPYVEELFEY
ncbi:hypothetical protein N7457_007293 [Penicillium paradoxum]|uniref:uncharacterized protein n=1 Tax=Penicillium paradoxum TaxID=176176 RepID=UPI002546F0A8|nr:uncharacterized protein N7457_007293 [Penicillium paradoxum]KAJ5779573.1 hypothetical protein N7457_007293 [Penicillium paradoxum]